MFFSVSESFEHKIYDICGIKIKVKKKKKFKKVNTRKVRMYSVNDKQLKLSPGHKLDAIQNAYPYYDKFLPLLTKNYINQGYVIDIGANVGDSLYGMIYDNSVKFVCIEPEDEFFEYLKENTEKLKEYFKNINERVILKKYAISQKESNISLKSYHGTATRDTAENDNKITAISLDNLLSELNIEPKDCSLLKIDTDGYDFDCMLSGNNTLRQSNCFIFWENLTTSDMLEEYQKAMDFILECGYTKFYIFDDFGDFISTVSGKDIKMFQKSQVKTRFNKTHYYDIFACKQEQEELCDKILEDYINNVMIEE